MSPTVAVHRLRMCMSGTGVEWEASTRVMAEVIFLTASTILHYCSKYVLILYATEKSILILLPSVKYIEGQRRHVQVKYVCLESLTALLSFSKVAFLGMPDLYTSHYKSYCSLVCELVHEHYCYYV